jgi:hypothetical protein
LGDAENAARTDDLAASAASGAGFCSGALLGPAAFAGIAFTQLGDGDFLFATQGGFQEGEFHVVAQIVAALSATGAAFAAAEEIVEDARVAEDFAENVGSWKPAGPRLRAPRPAWP